MNSGVSIQKPEGKSAKQSFFSSDLPDAEISTPAFLLRRVSGCAPRASDLHARRSQQPISHPVSATILSRHNSFALGLDFNRINSLVQLGVKFCADDGD
jgi:hypothetical protein